MSLLGGLGGGFEGLFGGVMSLIGMGPNEDMQKQEKKMKEMYDSQKLELENKRKDLYNSHLKAIRSSYDGNWDPGSEDDYQDQEKTSGDKKDFGGVF